MVIGFLLLKLPRDFPIDTYINGLITFTVIISFIYTVVSLVEARKPIAAKFRELKDNCLAERQQSVVVVEDVSFYQPPSQLEEGGSARNGNHATLTNVVANVIANAAPARSPHGTVSSR
jgi:hypothetical protein